jgi:hypothetical protein
VWYSALSAFLSLYLRVLVVRSFLSQQSYPITPACFVTTTLLDCRLLYCQRYTNRTYSTSIDCRAIFPPSFTPN